MNLQASDFICIEDFNNWKNQPIEPLTPLFKHLSIKPHNIFVGLWQDEKPRVRTEAQKEIEKHLREPKIKTDLSKKAKKNLFNACHWLEVGAKWKTLTDPDTGAEYYFKTNFITLTIPTTGGELLDRSLAESEIEVNPDGSVIALSIAQQNFINGHLFEYNLVQKCLNTLLTLLRKQCGLGNYVWKMEAQQNGQLHIHLNTDQFIHWKYLTKAWNRIMQKNGMLDEFFKANGHYSPNSTDIHSIKKGYDAIGYIGKYMSKNPNFAKEYKGKIWGCSKALSPVNKVSIKLNADEFSAWGQEMLASKIEFKPVEIASKSDGTLTKIGTIFFLKNKDWAKIWHEKVKTAFNNHVIYISSKTPILPKEYYQTNLFSSHKDRLVKDPDPTEWHENDNNFYNPNQIEFDF